MNAIARVETVVSIVRVYAADAPPPAPYLWAAVVHGILGWAIVEGLVAQRPTAAQAQAVRRCLAAAGYHTAWWMRRDASGRLWARGGPTGLAPDDPRVNNA